MISAQHLKTLVSSLATLLILLVMILWMAGFFENKIEPGLLPVKPDQSEEAYTVTLGQISLYEEVTGTVQSRQAADIAAQIQARIKAIHVKSGDLVKPGDLLVTLDDESLKARRGQAQANLNAVGARLNGAKAHYDRTRGLFAKESATQADYDRAKAEYQSLQSQFSAAQQQLAETRTVHDYGEIRATFPARVVDRFAEPGTIAQPGMKLLHVYDPSALRIDAYVRETIAVKLKVGETLTGELEALKTQVSAIIEEIVPAAHFGARSFLIKLSIEQQPGLLPGMFARIRIPLGTEQAIMLPQKYIRSVGQLDVVWIQEDGRINRRFVRLGSVLDGKVKIIAGLSAGENVVRPVLP